MVNIFSERLKDLRVAKSTLQKDIADILDVSVRQYQRYEKGEQEPNINGLMTLADYFDVSLDYLVGRSDDPKINE